MVTAEPVELAPGVLLLPGFHGDPADAFLVPVNALALGATDRLLVVPGARCAPWATALAPVADSVRWIVSARPGADADLAVALGCCPHARAVTTVDAAQAAGRFVVVDARPTRPARAVVDLDRRAAYTGDAFGAPVLLPVTEAADLDGDYWCRALRRHAGGSASGGALAALLGEWKADVDVAVPAFGPVVRGAAIAAAHQVVADPRCEGDGVATYRAALDGLVAASDGPRGSW